MINRLISTIYILMNKGTVTAAELAERFEVSVRTIYRDIDTLSMAGIPVYATKGRGGGIHLTKQFVLDKMLVSKQEQKQILAALSSLRETGVPESEEVLSKLRDFFMENSTDWVSIDFSDWSDRRRELFNLIREAVINRHVIEFDYYGQSGEISHRQAEPVQLLFKEYTWYVRAFCRSRQAMRLFKVLRMKRVELLTETFTPKALADGRLISQDACPPKTAAHTHDTNVTFIQDSSNEAFHTDEPSVMPITNEVTAENAIGNAGTFCGSDDLPEITLLIDRREAYRIYDRFEEEDITVLPDGHFKVSMHCCIDDWVFGVILSFGASAQVLEPEWMRQEMRRRITEMGKLYEDISSSK